MIVVPARYHPVLAVALLVMAIALLFRFILQPAWSKSAQLHEQIEQQYIVLDKLKQISTQNDALQTRLQEWGKHGGLQYYVIEKQSEGLATAGLQKKLIDMVNRYGGQLQKTQTLRTQDEGQLMRVQVAVQVRSDLKQMQSIFQSIESHRPLMFIDELQISRQKLRRSRSRQRNDVQPRQLNYQFTVSSYMVTK